MATPTNFGNSNYTQHELSDRSKFFEAINRKSGVSETSVKVLKAIMPPKGHPAHKTQTQAALDACPEKNPATVLSQAYHDAYIVLCDIIYGVQRTEREAQVQAELKAKANQPRKVRQPKDNTQAVARKEFIRGLRGSLGMGARGRLNPTKIVEYTEKLTAWDADHSSVPVTLIEAPEAHDEAHDGVTA